MNLYVGNLSYDLTEDELRAAFEQFGTVSSCNLITDRETGRAKGFGFVQSKPAGSFSPVAVTPDALAAMMKDISPPILVPTNTARSTASSSSRANISCT